MGDFFRINDEYEIEIFSMNGDQWRFWVDCYKDGRCWTSFTIEAHKGCPYGWGDMYGKDRIPPADQELIAVVVKRIWHMRLFL